MAVIIGIPILFVLAGTIGALSFAAPLPELEPIAEPEPVAAKPERAPGLAGAGFLKPHVAVAGSARADGAIDDLLASIESHLRQDREAAAKFARDPSPRTLWVN